MDCEKAARRLRHILARHAATQEIAHLPAVKKLLTRGEDRHWKLHAVLPVVCVAILFVMYCYCHHKSTSGIQQTMTGHYDDMANLAT